MRPQLVCGLQRVKKFVKRGKNSHSRYLGFAHQHLLLIREKTIRLKLKPVITSTFCHVIGKKNRELYPANIYVCRGEGA